MTLREVLQRRFETLGVEVSVQPEAARHQIGAAALCAPVQVPEASLQERQRHARDNARHVLAVTQRLYHASPLRLYLRAQFIREARGWRGEAQTTIFNKEDNALGGHALEQLIDAHSSPSSTSLF